jgi:hypothetical protein
MDVDNQFGHPKSQDFPSQLLFGKQAAPQQQIAFATQSFVQV